MAPSTVQPPLEFIPPAFNSWVCRAAQFITPAWLHWRTRIDGFEYEGLAELVSLMDQFERGQVRLLLAFRHPTANDPLCLMQLFGHDLPRVAKRGGVALKKLQHFHFMYDRGIPLWAGDFVGWLYSKLGGVPIHRGKVDVKGLRSARDLLVNGQFPLAAAPERATNGHSEIVSPIEPGVAQLGVWAVQDLLKAERSETVLIVPVGIRYSFGKQPWDAIDRLLRQLEQDCGLEALTRVEEVDEVRYGRLYRLAIAALVLMEQHYHQFYQQPLPDNSAIELLALEQTVPSLEPEALLSRFQKLLDAVLAVAERHFDLQAKGSFANRCRRLEQAGWDRIYREDFGELAELSAVELGLANRVAVEAQMQLWHMRLVESFVAVTGRYVREQPTAERFAESALLLWKLFAQLKGETKSKYPRLGRRRVKMTVGKPLSVTEVYAAALASGEKPRRAGRTAVEVLDGQLQAALEAVTS